MELPDDICSWKWYPDNEDFGNPLKCDRCYNVFMSDTYSISLRDVFVALAKHAEECLVPKDM